MLSPQLIKAALKHFNYRGEKNPKKHLISALYKRKACKSDCIVCTLLGGITHKYFFTIVVKHSSVLGLQGLVNIQARTRGQCPALLALVGLQQAVQMLQVGNYVVFYIWN